MPSNHLIPCRPLLLSPSILYQSLSKWVSSLHQMAKVLEFQLQHQTFQWIFRTDGRGGLVCCRSWGHKELDTTEQLNWTELISFRMDWLDLLGVQGTLKGLLQHHSSKPSILQCSAFFIVQLSHPDMTTGKTIALTRRTLFGKVMSLLFIMLSRLVIAFIPRSNCLLTAWLQSPSAVILEPPKIKSVTVFTVSPSICHEVMGPDAMILVFWMLSVRLAFSLSSFTFIMKLFSSLLSAIRVVSSAYLRWLIFLPAISAWLIPACASSSPVFLMMYSAYKLNKQGDNIQLWCTPFPIWNQSVVPCPVLTVASWPEYRFSRGRPGGLVFPSLEEFSTVYCDSHSQRLWHSQ